MKKNEGAIMKNKVDYIELPFKVFIKKYPNALEMFPPDVRADLMSDPCYIVRLSSDDKNTKIEVGYRSDNWSVK